MPRLRRQRTPLEEFVRGEMDLIARLRLEGPRNYKELAEALGVAPSQLHRYLTGATTLQDDGPARVTRQKLARAIGCVQDKIPSAHSPGPRRPENFSG